jgi:hypothetical protein
VSAAAEIRFALQKLFSRDNEAEKKVDACLDAFANDLLARYMGRLRDFTPVWTRSDGSDVPATELRCILCGGLAQGVGVKTLLDINALASSHNCQTRKDGRS